MSLSLRFVLPLLIVLAGFAYMVVPLVDQLNLRWSVRDIESRSALIANTIQEPLQNQLSTGSKKEILNFFTKITQDERLYALGYCASGHSPIIAVSRMP